MELNATVRTAADLVRNIPPDRLDAPTPCRDWDVRTLTNHLHQVVTALHLAGRGGPVPDDLWSRDLAGDPDRFDAEARGAIEAWAEPPAGMIALGAATVPAPLVATMLASDLVLHGWDLAKATGQVFACDDEAIAMTSRFIADTAAEGRTMGLYAEPVPVAADASALDRAVGASGRDPGWTPVAGREVRAYK
jgi:uncharacterized protein (TIGR03086 family)